MLYEKSELLEEIQLLAEHASKNHMPAIGLRLNAVLEQCILEIETNKFASVSLNNAGIDFASRTVTVGGTKIRPPKREFMMCAFLARRPEVIRTRAEIMTAADMSMDSDELCVASMVKRIRKRGVTQIKTRQGEGYYWSTEAA